MVCVVCSFSNADENASLVFQAKKTLHLVPNTSTWITLKPLFVNSPLISKATQRTNLFALYPQTGVHRVLHIRVYLGRDADQSGNAGGREREIKGSIRRSRRHSRHRHPINCVHRTVLLTTAGNKKQRANRWPKQTLRKRGEGHKKQERRQCH